MRYAVLIATFALLAGALDAQRPRTPRPAPGQPQAQPAPGEAAKPMLNPKDGAVGARFPSITPDGQTLVFTLHGDIWSMPATGGRATRLTLHQGYDTRPLVTPDGKEVVFISDRNGSYDLFAMPIDGGQPRRLTFDASADVPCGFTADGKQVLFFSNRAAGWSRGGTFDIWRMPLTGGTAERVTTTGGRDCSTPDDSTTLFFVDGASDSKVQDYKGSANDRLYRQISGQAPEHLLPFEGNSREPAASADGKRLRFTREINTSFEIFEHDFEKGSTTQLTKLGEQGVSNVSYSSDWNTAYFVWKFYLWSLDMKDPAAKPVMLKIEVREDSRGEPTVSRTFTSGIERASLSRDGRNVVFALGGDLWIMESSGGAARQITSDAFQNHNPQLSPDNRTISFYSDRSGNNDIWLIDVDGKNMRQFTADPADDFFQTWSPDGQSIVFTSTRSGNKDIWLQRLDGTSAVQLTNAPGNDDDAVFTPDGRQIVFDSDRAGNADIWIMDLDGKNPRRIYGTPAIEEVPVVSPDGRFIAFDRVIPGGITARSEVLMTDLAGSGEVSIGQGAYPSFTPDGKEIMYVNRAGELVSAPTPAGIQNGRKISFLASKQVSEKEEMLRAFDEAHRAFGQSFYDPKFHGRDWEALGRKYRELVQNCGSREEYMYYLNRMVGEVSASHTGARGDTMKAAPAVTGLTGMSVTPEPMPGNRLRLRVDSVDKGGPADAAWIRKGDYVFRVEGRPLAANHDFSAALEGKVGEEVTLWVADNPEGSNTREVKVKCEAFGQKRQRAYTEFVRGNKTTSARESRGQVAYIHIPSMMPQNLAAFENELAGQQVQNAKALIIDVRDNGGGNIHQGLIDILSRKPYAYIRNRDGRRTGQPPVYWNRPIVVLINERSYSDAEVFPHAMKTLGMATIVGMPTPGAVIGTRDIRLSDGTSWRLPMSGFFNSDNTNQEHNGCVPHIMVDNTPADIMAGHDAQLARAIAAAQDLLKQKAAPEPEPGPTPTAPPQKEGDFKSPEEWGWVLPHEEMARTVYLP